MHRGCSISNCLGKIHVSEIRAPWQGDRDTQERSDQGHVWHKRIHTGSDWILYSLWLGFIIHPLVEKFQIHTSTYYSPF